ncbi:DgyrCDS2908 [Dimorphilus gyrociliatus]|uniref:DgyrCDS2908 n=1 Tax=Dimorphilus gyrociliatus TaxID=2664684 RepID=A0A7I8VEC9_9ANNE|nr:DgyrCDS2908 [Dimorphilus gyrociliatus]
MEKLRRRHFPDSEVESGFPEDVQDFINQAYIHNETSYPQESHPYVRKSDYERESRSDDNISIDYTYETSPYTSCIHYTSYDDIDDDIVVDEQFSERHSFLSAPIDHTRELSPEIRNKYRQYEELKIELPPKVLARHKPNTKEGWEIPQRRLERLRAEKYETNFRKSLRRAIYGAITTRLTLRTSQILKNKENRKQARNGGQVDLDNPSEDDLQYYGSLKSGLIITTVVFLPLGSIIVFTAVNSYWVLTVLIHLNQQTAEDASFRENLDKKLKDYGDVVNDALKFSMENATKTREKSEEFAKVGIFHKIFYSFNDVRIMGLVLIWEVFALLPVIVYAIDKSDERTKIFFYIYIFLILLANYHLMMVALITDILILGTILSFIIYPIGTLICFKLRFRSYGMTVDSNDEQSTLIHELRNNEDLVAIRMRKRID